MWCQQSAFLSYQNLLLKYRKTFCLLCRLGSVPHGWSTLLIHNPCKRISASIYLNLPIKWAAGKIVTCLNPPVWADVKLIIIPTDLSIISLDSLTFVFTIAEKWMFFRKRLPLGRFIGFELCRLFRESFAVSGRKTTPKDNRKVRVEHSSMTLLSALLGKRKIIIGLQMNCSEWRATSLHRNLV